MDRVAGSAIAIGAVVFAAAACAHGTSLADTRAADDARIIAVADSAVIARGRYLAYGPAHCVACHTPAGPLTTWAGEEKPPLAGGFTIHFTGGNVVTPNLTPDAETGIGRRTDRDLVRMLRYGTRHDGSKALPVMSFQNMSDDDLQAVISFLRAQPPVHNAVPNRHLSLIGRFGMWAFVSAKDPDSIPPRSPPRHDPLARGAYLVNDVAACANCHTERSSVTGSLKGARLAGGWKMPIEGDRDRQLVTPNLTPDPRTGIIANWSEDQFVERFRAGPAIHGSHMPWMAYATMSENDLRAIYRYLRSLPPVEHDTGPVIRQKLDEPV